MPVALVPSSEPESSGVFRKRWTREECSVLESAGLVELQRYERINGVYRSVLEYAEHELVACLAAPESTVRTGDLF